MDYNEKIFISFAVKIDETVRFSCRTTGNNNIAEKEIFRMGGFYFFYVFNRTERLNTYSLREISKDEFYNRKREFMNLRPNSATSEWVDKANNSFSVKNYYNGYWKRNVPAQDCMFITDNNPLKEIYDAVLSESAMRKAQNVAFDKEEKYEYARKCGGMGRKLGIAYVNVLRIGPEKGKLMKFKESYERAIKKSASMSLAECRELHNDLFRRGRASRKKAMDDLGIQYFDVDVNLLALDEMEKHLLERLNAYMEESVRTAKINLAQADYATRQQIYEALMNSNRRQKKEAMTQLGIDVAAIDISKYPLSDIKRALAATLGLETER